MTRLMSFITTCPALTEDNKCAIHDRKPSRCRTMPFSPYRDEAHQDDLLVPRDDWECDISADAPLVYRDGESADSLGIDGTETFDIDVHDDLEPRQTLKIKAARADGTVIEFEAIARVDTPIEVDYLRNGGILHYVLRGMTSV